MIFKSRKLHFCLLLIGLVFLAYSNVYLFQFLYDDEFFIVKNSFLDSFLNLGNIFSHSLTGGSGYADSFYRPLQASLYLVTNQIFGRQPWAFHFLNVFLHSMNAVLIFILAIRFRLSPWLAFAAAALWGVHPIHTECVAYMSGTADSLHTLFMLLALVYVTPDFTQFKMITALGFFVLALMSKEAAIVLPALLVSVIFFFEEKKWTFRPYLKTIPFWIVALGYLYLRSTLLNFDQDFSFFKTENLYTQNITYRVYTFFATLPNYVELLFFPHDLHIDRKFSVYTDMLNAKVLLGLGLVISASAVLILNFLRRPLLIWPAWIILWFAAAYAPHTGILVPMNSLFLEHWMYSPSIGLCMGLGALVEWSLQKKQSLKKLTAVVISITVIILSTLTYKQNRVWSNPITLYSHILNHNPSVARVRHNLAMHFSEVGDLTRALEEYEAVLKTQGDYPQTYHNMGRIYRTQGKLDLAEQSFLKALELSPNFFPSLGELANLYSAKGDHINAEKYGELYNQVRGQ